MAKLNIRTDNQGITVRVPIAIRKRGGRKVVLTPKGVNLVSAPAHRHQDDAVIKAIARAFRWRELLESGTCSTIAEIAEAEQINETYVGRVLRLALLKPQIVETILNDGVPALQLNELMKSFPIQWESQQDHFGLRTG